MPVVPVVEGKSKENQVMWVQRVLGQAGLRSCLKTKAKQCKQKSPNGGEEESARAE